MPKGWRFRTGWRGALVLQRRFEWVDYYYYSPGTCSDWRDATTEDLVDFIKENAHEQLPTA
ncbi:hypothetical protein H4CHR_02925 [Variovorax sp. PBS-H4]|uniref:hypothetical protein n=1 Tax=Variovorax sp. PBS-H4 TaxID=434008 RepID=UPI001315C4DE|nr:hypothetical protein [Variovorax sp. PBS-H4]VTU32016.1 hypothetical protein H4CHR_02925 [Variovorax sp. PBS-H4]